MSRFNEQLILSIQWLTDTQRGEMIEAENYKRDHISFTTISKVGLTRICGILNMILLWNRKPFYTVKRFHSIWLQRKW